MTVGTPEVPGSQGDPSALYQQGRLLEDRCLQAAAPGLCQQVIMWGLSVVLYPCVIEEKLVSEKLGTNGPTDTEARLCPGLLGEMVCVQEDLFSLGTPSAWDYTSAMTQKQK